MSRDGPMELARAELEQWLDERLEQLGAQVLPGLRVAAEQGLLTRGDFVEILDVSLRPLPTEFAAEVVRLAMPPGRAQ